MKALYPAIIDKDTNSDYGISFPDFPGCVSAGKSIEDAIQMGAEALSFHISGMVEDGDTIPSPTQIDQVIPQSPETTLCIVMIQAIIPGRSKRLNITLDESLIAEIDAVTKNRSGFLADAARAELSRRASA